MKKETEKRIKEIEEKVDAEFYFELYKVRYELLLDMIIQVEWLMTDEGKAANGTEQAELEVEKGKKSILAFKEQLDFVKTKL